MTMMLLPALCALLAPGDGPPRRWYDEARMAALRGNLARFDWARQQRDAILQRADGWVALGDERLRVLVPPPTVPRSHVVHASGCPVHGAELNRIGMYRWIITPDRPWQVKCPVAGEVYPSNDFAAYLAGGQRNRDLLTGPYADDGWGWRKEGVARKYWFVAYWAHWSARNFVLPALTDLSQAHLITGDARYAHAAAVLLWQLAQYYPDYRYEQQSSYGTEFDPHYYGRLLYHTWECFTVQAVAPAYDAIRATIDQDTALQAWAKLTGPAIRASLEERLLRTMARDIMAQPPIIQGNYGMHQTGLLWLATVLGDDPGEPARQAMVDWVLRNRNVTSYTGIGFEDALYNLIHRDGFPFENPGYNSHWITELTAVAEALRGAGVEVYREPRFQKVLRWPLALACAGEFTPALGDGGNLFSRVLGWSYQTGRGALERLADPAYARAVLQADAKPSPDLFSPPLDDTAQRLAAQHPDPVGVTSTLLPGVGYATLQTGTTDNRTAVSLFYGYYVGHAHYDRLHIDLFSHRQSLLPDFGYPETADTYDPRRFGFFAHTVAHNTLMVDGRRQDAAPGRLHAFDSGPFAQVVEVSAEAAYPTLAAVYRRTLLLVDATPEQAYLVDIFRVRGGRQHDLLAHFGDGTLTAEPAFGPVREAGTLAGPGVPYGQFYDDPKLRDQPVGTVPYHGYTGSGFQWLFNVREAPRRDAAQVTYQVARPRNLPAGATVALRAHLLGDPATLLAAEGRPQNLAALPKTVPFLVRRRTGEALESTLVTVWEPYRARPFLTSVRPLTVRGDGWPVALEVTLADGRRQVVLSQLADGEERPVAIPTAAGPLRTGAAVLVAERESSGRLTRSYVLSGGPGVWGADALPGRPAVRSTVAAVDYARHEVTLAAGGLNPAAPPAWAVAPNAAAVVPVAELLGPQRFSTGDDDLVAGRYRVTASDATGVTVSPPFVYLAFPGVAAVDEAGAPRGRMTARASGRIALDPPLASVTSLPDSSGEGDRTLRLVVVAPGDELVFHHGTRWTR